MNIVDMIILAILAYGLLAGMYKGSITSGLSLLGFLGAWWGAQSVCHSIANFALSNTTLMAVLNQYLEPESFFTNHAQAVMAVKDVIAGGEAGFTEAVDAISGKFAFLADAFSNNVRTEAFANLGITSLADYFNQTLWVAVFNVLAFVLAFIAFYIVISLLINMLDHIVSFPVLRSFDWLLGGVMGLARASVVVVLVLSILPAISSLISADMTQQLLSGSALYTFASQFDPLSVGRLIRNLVMG